MEQGADTSGRNEGLLALAVANMAVRVLRAYAGRGPTKSRTVIDDDLIIVVLRETLTTAERTLVANGQGRTVLAARQALHDAMRHDLIAGVEEHTGRAVVAFFNDTSVEPDVTLESFLLAPQA